MKKLHVGVSPLTGTIFAGHVLRDGTWGAGKQDVTDSAMAAAVERLMHLERPVEMHDGAGNTYRLSLEVIPADVAASITKPTPHPLP